MALKIRQDGTWVDLIKIPEIPEATSSISAVADGAIQANKPVILTGAGKAKAIQDEPESQASSPSTFFTGSSDDQIYNVQSATWDTSQNVVIATWAVDSTDTGDDERVKIQAGTISGTSITWGKSDFTITSSNQGYTGVTTSYDSTVASNGNGGGILYYRYETNKAPVGNPTTYEIWANTFTVNAASISNTNSGITIGTPFHVTGAGEGSLQPGTPAMGYLGKDGNFDYYGVAAVTSDGTGTVSILKHNGQNNVTQGTQKAFNQPHTTDANNVVLVPISLDRFVIFWDNGDTVVCTRSGTEVFVGEQYEIGGTQDTILSGTYDSINDKVIFASASGVVKVCTVSGTNINLSFESRFGVSTNVGGTTGRFPRVVSTDKGQVLVYYNAQTPNDYYGKQVIGTWNDARTTIEWGTTITWRSEVVRWAELVKADDGKVVTVFAEVTSTSPDIYSGKSWVTQTATTTLTKDNFFGFSHGNYTNVEAIIDVIGKTTTQPGPLTINEKYYVQDDGTIGIGKSSFSILAGKAISANKLLITPDYYDADVQGASSGGGGGGSGGGGTTTIPNVVTSNTTAASNQLIIVNNSGLTITLPASPDVADIVEVRVLGTRYCTVARNNSKIESLEEDLYIDTIDGYVRLIYTDATQGWIIAS